MLIKTLVWCTNDERHGDYRDTITEISQRNEIYTMYTKSKIDVKWEKRHEDVGDPKIVVTCIKYRQNYWIHIFYLWLKLTGAARTLKNY